MFEVRATRAISTSVHLKLGLQGPEACRSSPKFLYGHLFLFAEGNMFLWFVESSIKVPLRPGLTVPSFCCYTQRGISCGYFRCDNWGGVDGLTGRKIWGTGLYARVVRASTCLLVITYQQFCKKGVRSEQTWPKKKEEGNTDKRYSLRKKPEGPATNISPGVRQVLYNF